MGLPNVQKTGWKYLMPKICTSVPSWIHIALFTYHHHHHHDILLKPLFYFFPECIYLALGNFDPSPWGEVLSFFAMFYFFGVSGVLTVVPSTPPTNRNSFFAGEKPWKSGVPRVVLFSRSSSRHISMPSYTFVYVSTRTLVILQHNATMWIYSQGDVKKNLDDGFPSSRV